jgi:putative transposase
MPNYRRAHVPGGTFFLTLVAENRAPLFNEERARRFLHDAIAHCARRRPFRLDAVVLLPDHLHLMLTLPPDDADFSIRVASIKSALTRAYLAAGGAEQPRSASRVRKRRRGVWQRWFWEHTLRDADDRNRHLDYIHYNAVKHGLAPCPHARPHSTFHRHVGDGYYEPHWQCACNGRVRRPPDFSGLAVGEMEGEGDDPETDEQKPGG